LRLADERVARSGAPGPLPREDSLIQRASGSEFTRVEPKRRGGVTFQSGSGQSGSGLGRVDGPELPRFELGFAPPLPSRPRGIMRRPTRIEPLDRASQRRATDIARVHCGRDGDGEDRGTPLGERPARPVRILPGSAENACHPARQRPLFGSGPHSRRGMKSPDAYHARACAIVSRFRDAGGPIFGGALQIGGPRQPERPAEQPKRTAADPRFSADPISVAAAFD
jgi:hypothetical protein